MCEICGMSPCESRCPNHTPKKAYYYCSICGEGIYLGDEYIENVEGERIHFSCVQGIKQLLEWLGYEVKECDEFEYYKECNFDF